MAAWIVVHPEVASQQPPSIDVVVSTEWLAAHLKDPDVVVVNVGLTLEDLAAYDSSHVRGARFLPYAKFTRRSNGLTSEIAPTADLEPVLESIGISDASRIVIYGAPIVSHRLFVSLEASGLRGRVGMLDGGFERWRQENRAVTSEVSKVRKGSLTLKPAGDVVVDREWVKAHLDDGGVQLVDGRPRGSFEGTRLPGATSAPFMSLIRFGDRSWSLLPGDTLRARLGAKAGKELVTYCAVGEVASGVYFVARSLGIPVKLYDGSMEDWQAAGNLPVEKGRPTGQP